MTFSEVTGLLFITEETMFNYTNKYTTFGAQKEKKKKKKRCKDCYNFSASAKIEQSLSIGRDKLLIPDEKIKIIIIK